MRTDRLRYLREKQGLSQEEFAEALGETRLQVWRWENDKYTPDSVAVAHIAKFFNVSSDYLLGLSDDMSPDLRKSDLSEVERTVVSALRQNDPLEAIRVIVNETP